MMLRGESSRNAELSGLCAINLTNEGSPCLAVVLRMTKGKTIELKDRSSPGKVQYSGFLRHRDVHLCAVGAPAQWLIFRWDMAGEAIPVFSNRLPWYGTKLMPVSLKNPAKEMPSVTQRSWIKRALGDLTIASSKVVYTIRQFGARLSDLNEVPTNQLSPPSFHPFTSLKDFY